MKHDCTESQSGPVEQGAISFEAAFSRLEQILELMNSGTVGLEESILLFEEANRLLVTCNEKLTTAERRIETLVKNRNGELVLGADQKPIVQEGHKR